MTLKVTHIKGMARFDRPLCHFISMVCSNNVTVLHHFPSIDMSMGRSLFFPALSLFSLLFLFYFLSSSSLLVFLFFLILFPPFFILSHQFPPFPRFLFLSSFPPLRSPINPAKGSRGAL